MEKTFTRTNISLDKGWKFHDGNVKDAESLAFDDSGWKTINVPHDWRIHEKRDKNNSSYSGFAPTGIGWYRRVLNIGAEYKGSRVYVEFEGVFRNCTVWLNGKKAGSHLSGYTGFVIDITDFVDFASPVNVMAILVDNLAAAPAGRYAGVEGWWYEGYGIYRHVDLTITHPIHVPNWGTFVYTENVSEKSAVVKMNTRVKNDTDSVAMLTLRTSIFNPNGEQVAVKSDKCHIDGKQQLEVSQKTLVSNPELWSTEKPLLYRMITEVCAGAVIVDKYETSFGIRWFEFTPDKGFLLNGKHLQLRGMNLHHDYGGLGCALPDRANYKTLELAKEMGVNCIRSAHNDAAPSLMRACDEMGLLLWAETRYRGTDDYSISSLVDMIDRDRNHPSIICWSLANTAGADDPEETRILKAMNGCAHREDPTRPTAFASEENGDPNKSGYAFVTDIMGYNGGGMGRDDHDHATYPARKMLISEFSSGRGARGNYKRENMTKLVKLGDGRTVSMSGQLTSIYDLCRSHEKEWRHIAERPHLAGGFMWSGVEYGGETNGWPVVTSQFGVLDICRFKKDAFYFYQQEWTDKPMVHVFPHWNWKKGDTIDVWAYSNCDEVDLIVNGESVGKRSKVPFGHMEWKVPFRPGILTAKAFRNGILVAETNVRTADEPEQLTLSADRSSIASGGTDVSFVTIKVCDKYGTMDPTADNLIEVEVTGGKLLGICSGDPMSHENPASRKMKAFNGMLLAIVQSPDDPGKIAVSAKSQGLGLASIIVSAE